jgi:hypothetical protein
VYSRPHQLGKLCFYDRSADYSKWVEKREFACELLRVHAFNFGIIQSAMHETPDLGPAACGNSKQKDEAVNCKNDEGKCDTLLLSP